MASDNIVGVVRVTVMEIDGRIAELYKVNMHNSVYHYNFLDFINWCTSNASTYMFDITYNNKFFYPLSDWLTILEDMGHIKNTSLTILKS